MLLLCKAVFTQTPSFYHLTTANGLYDNHVRSLAIDQQGFLWIGTEEGLNKYDGHSISVYLKEKYPGLPSDLITYLFCDSRNRIWVGTSEGVACMDSRAQLHRVALQDTIVNFIAKAIIETRKRGVTLVTDKEDRKGAPAKEQIDLLLQNLRQAAKPALQRIALTTNDGMLFVCTANILYCEAESNYTTVVLNNRKIVVSKTLKEIDEALAGPEFYRIHHSFLINLNHIAKYVRGDGGYIMMTNDKAVSISRSKRQEFMELFSKF